MRKVRNPVAGTFVYFTHTACCLKRSTFDKAAHFCARLELLYSNLSHNHKCIVKHMHTPHTTACIHRRHVTLTTHPCGNARASYLLCIYLGRRCAQRKQRNTQMGNYTQRKLREALNTLLCQKIILIKTVVGVCACLLYLYHQERARNHHLIGEQFD